MGEILFLILIFFGIHIILSWLTLFFRFLAGIGTWFAYLGGIAAFSALFARNHGNARVLTAASAFAAIISVYELGAVFGRFLELTVLGFNSLVTKCAACILLLGEGWVMNRYRLHGYHVSVHAARLVLVSCFATAISVVTFDLCQVHVFGYGADPGILGLMTVILLAFFVINAVSYLMTYHICREYTSVLELTAENQINKSAQSLMAVTEENLSELHKIRHDILNQYAYMRELMDSGDYEGLHSYFDELTSTFSQVPGSAIDYGNHVLNLIFNMEHSKASSMRVLVDFKAAVPHQLPFSDLDLVKLYSNIIDNALEACAGENQREQAVQVTVNTVGDYLYTQVKNPTVKEASFLNSGFPTAKEDARIHGKGAGIIRGIIRKYDGSIRYNIQDGWFIVEVMLCLKEKAIS